ncbi:hypothetical protein SNE40_010799 [Patella caerulea]|uniref:Cyclin-like domain-containing protein n=1 Tax=Patella caerulea TaxID=87958 RepID=A0AAN8K1Q5_PATCE
MPCWYFEKKDIKNSPSIRDGLDIATEGRYRKEGARFIIDAGTKLGLRYDTCATGVTYFHRFYMFHSFKEFHRYVTAACCLFLSGKVEETPKKCKDIIKICQSLLSPSLFAVFGDDPREEIMTMERILLQTIKFDLQIDHPYGKVLKYAKFVLGDKEKIQKMVQMAWTFINDSMCTTLCLQWEPDIIATSLLYLASRLTKFEITDWQGKVPGSKIKWWDAIVEDISMELMEDICHQVLDLYSPENRKKEESPPLSPSGKSKTGGGTPSKVRGPTSPAEGGPPSKQVKLDPKGGNPRKPAPPQHPVPAQPGQVMYTSSGYTPYNPYIQSGMYSSSFMSQEGNQKIQALFGNSTQASQPAYQNYPPAQQIRPNTVTSAAPYSAGAYPPGYQPPPGYPPAPTSAGYTQPYPGGYPPASGYPPGTQPPQQQYAHPPPGFNQYQYPPAQQPPQYTAPPAGYPPSTIPPTYQAPGYPPTSTAGIPQSQPGSDTTQSGLATVRITQRR